MKKNNDTLKISLSAKNKKILISVCAVALAIVLVLSIVLPIVLLNRGDKPFEIPENKLPIEEKYALTKYEYDELGDVQATLRSDAMLVTKRNVERQAPEMLSNDFSLVYDKNANQLRPEYQAVTGNDNLSVASISFIEDNYPSPKKASVAAPYEEAAQAAGVSTAQYYSYFKYMLMTQGQHLALEAARRSAETASDNDGVDPAFKAWLKKHPSADDQYGAVLGENNAVVKEITLDPLYRSPHATGLYLPAGEAVTIKVEGLKPGEKITLEIGLQNSLAWRGGIPSGGAADIEELTDGNYTNVNYANASSDAFFKQADLLTAGGNFFKYNTVGNTPFLQSQWARQDTRAPWVIAQFVFTQNKTYTVGTHFGGVMHIGMGNCYSSVKTTISGAVETPHYILGVTTPEYFDEYLRQAPGVIAVLDTENGQLIGPTGEMGTTQYMRQVKTEEVDKLAMLWHSFLSVNESFTGGPYNRFNKVMFDQHVPAGAAVALGNYSFAHPTSWFNGAMNYRGLLKGGTWGILHEIGHSHGGSYGSIWGFGGGQEGEVRNNALILLSYIMFTDIGTTVRNGGGAEHGEYTDPYKTLSETIANKGKMTDFNQFTYFPTLGMYANIMHSFGAEKYYELLYTYKDNPSYSSDKRADFAYRCSLIYGMNFIKYFNDFYAANIKDDKFTEQQLAEMNALPNYEPVANKYAGGIDGVKTSGDYNVAYGEPITFDLKGTTISSLDTAESKGFEIISVNKPEHGKISQTADGQWKYTFDPKYTGTHDSFSFNVKLADGVIHTLTIYLRISYNGTRLTAYNGIEGRNWDDILLETTNKTPDSVVGSPYSYIPTYQTEKNKWDVRVSEFYWKAPKSGEISLSAKCDDWVQIYFGETFENIESVLQISTYTAGFKDYKVNKTVKEGEFYAVRIFNVNGGGGGSATLGIKYADEDYAAPNLADVYHPDYPLGKESETYIFEPNYIISKKDNVKISTTGTDKRDWTVVKAPENIHGGRYLEETMVDEETGEVSILKTDKWSYLIDGVNGTILHTAYGGGVPQITETNPHEFVIDTMAVQGFNYVSIVGRNNVNSYINDCEVFLSETGADGSWVSVAKGDRETYSGITLTMKFDTKNGRYIKIVVKGTTGGNFSVIGEIDAGINSSTQRVIPSTSSRLYASKGWQNSSSISGEPSGFMIAEKKRSKLVFRFYGESVAIYAAIGEGYGVADIKLDGKKMQTVDFDSDVKELRKLVFAADNLKNKEHTVEIITKSADRVMINVLGIPYTAHIVNAPNIYLERGLTISLVVFIVLFITVTALVLALLFSPEFREKLFGNKAIKKLSEKNSKNGGSGDGSDGKTDKKQKAEKAEKERLAKAEAEKAKPQVKAKTEKPKTEEKTAQKPEAKTEQKAKPETKTTTTRVKTVGVKTTADKKSDGKK